ncbi:hypothetical protein Y88_3341 [Novosphingobium nitrogenifigens DSM 19370]|uniref:Uncharacterized protein n=1 Tax=Novosphingobium nitrogenifigens DSM 19370 TaxID=983920 RepID=F1ZBR3_9SPHN|nr:hypothetical protein [Novosphingobium nitrogenifigens]EGD58011.1 hypothetical protein Y88_3341 [Novosphingobium nitrogenifigens DSM 19370]
MHDDAQAMLPDETMQPLSAPELSSVEPQGETDTQSSPPWYDRPRSIPYKIASRLSRWTGGRVKSPAYHRSLQFRRKHDTKDLEKYRVSPDEHVQTWYFWTLEFFTPDNIAVLRGALERLKPAGQEYGECGPANWLRQERGRQGSSMELYLVPKEGRAWGPGHYCALPSFAKAAHGTIANITPSLTTLTMSFRLKDSERDWLDDELHRDHQPKIFQRPNGVVSISNVWLQQRAIVRERREKWAHEVTEWHRRHFPGLLSTNEEAVSCCLLDVIDGAEPFISETSNLLGALDLARTTAVYEYRAKDGQVLATMSRTANTDDASHLHLVSMTLNQLQSYEAAGYGSDNCGRISRFDSMFRRGFTSIALHRVLDFYNRKVVLARDSAAAIVGSRSATKALARVRADTAQCIDAAVVARELCHAAKTGWIPSDLLSFTYKPFFLNEKAQPLAEIIHERITRQSSELLADVAALNESLSVQADLLSAHANLKLQPWIIGLAIVSMLAGVLAAIGPVHDLLQPRTSVALPQLASPKSVDHPPKKI